MPAAESAASIRGRGPGPSSGPIVAARSISTMRSRSAAPGATGTSVRTLQRRLKDTGVNYNDLQNDVRKTLALNLLENETLALGEIAFSLGYSEVSAFNHAFRRWVGQSPGHYRRLRAARFKSDTKTAKSPARA